MPITPKPQRRHTGPVNIDALINKGGTPAPESSHAKPSDTAAVVLRLPSEMLAKVDDSVQSRPIRIPRHTWILEAIHEKLERETSPRS
jgi:hypothetical protein